MAIHQARQDDGLARDFFDHGLAMPGAQIIEGPNVLQPFARDDEAPLGDDFQSLILQRPAGRKVAQRQKLSEWAQQFHQGFNDPS